MIDLSNRNLAEFILKLFSLIPNGSKISFDGYEERESWQQPLDTFKIGKGFYVMRQEFKDSFTRLIKDTPDLLNKIPHLYIEDPSGKPLVKSFDHFDYVELDPDVEMYFFYQG
jgi:hypothetical protein